MPLKMYTLPMAISWGILSLQGQTEGPMKWGSLENRLRFPMEVLRRVRAKVGKDYPIIVRMNASDFIPGGQTFAEAKTIAKMCVDNGANVIDVSGIVRNATN